MRPCSRRLGPGLKKGAAMMSTTGVRGCLINEEVCVLYIDSRVEVFLPCIGSHVDVDNRCGGCPKDVSL